MAIRRRTAVGWVLLILAAACAKNHDHVRPGSESPVAEATAAPAASFMGMLSACPIPGQPDGWAVMWHQTVPGLDPTMTTRVFKYLEAPDFDDCLRLLIESDPNAHELVLGLKDGATAEETTAMQRAVLGRWKEFGVDRALEEVAASGERGNETARVLKECERLRGAEASQL